MTYIPDSPHVLSFIYLIIYLCMPVCNIYIYFQVVHHLKTFQLLLSYFVILAKYYILKCIFKKKKKNHFFWLLFEHKKGWILPSPFIDPSHGVN